MRSHEQDFQTQKAEVAESQGRELNTQSALMQEKTMLEKFRGKAKEVANVLVLTSILSATPGVINEAYAEKRKSGIRTEQTQEKSKNEINHTGLTESSTWSLSMMETIRKEAKNIRTREDAIKLIGQGKEIRLFFQELYAPTKGKLIKGWIINSREYSEDDLVLLYKSVKELDRLLRDLETNYNLDMREVRDKIVAPIEGDLGNQYLEKSRAKDRSEALEKKINK